MDPRNPFRTLAPSVDGDVIQVLARTHAPLTGARVAVLAERSPSQVRVVLQGLEQHGIVYSERHGQAYSYTLNRDHVLGDAIELILAAGKRFERRVADAIAAWAVKPSAAALFGSFARRDGDADSDVDVLLVRPVNVSEEDEAWSAQRRQLAASIQTWVGNPAQILEVGDEELTTAIRRGEPLVENLRRDAVTVFGDIASRLLIPERVPQ
jgi:predicted nucleotidyltransferase